MNPMSYRQVTKPMVAHTKRGEIVNLRGFAGEIAVKEKLWNYNYSVKHFSDMPFDLLINEKIRVEVKTTLMRDGGYWTFTLTGKRRADIFAFVFLYPDGHKEIRFIKASKIKRGIYGITFRPDDKKLEKSPLKIFSSVIIPNKKVEKNNQKNESEQ